MNAHNGHNGHQSSRQIEEDVERTRAHMAETLEELRSRMSPGQILDEVLGYAKETGGGQTVRNLGRTVQDNPAPLLLIGAGIAWMMASGSGRHSGADRGDSSRGSRNYGASGSEPGPDGDWADGLASAAESARRAGGRVADSVRSAGETMTDAAADLRDGISRTAQDISGAASSSMHDLRDRAYRTGDTAYRQGRDFGNSLVNSVGDQPLILGALGLALGAALGAALPETETEDRLMGETSDALKQRASEAAASGYEKAKSVAKSAIERAGAEAEAQGLTADAAEGAVSDIAARASAVVGATTDAAREEAARQGLTGDEPEDAQTGHRGSRFRGPYSTTDGTAS